MGVYSENRLLITTLVSNGLIYKDMSQDEIVHYLGDPDDVGGISRRRKRPLIWKYEDVEFGFDPKGYTLQMVYIDDSSEEYPVFLLREHGNWRSYIMSHFEEWLRDYFPDDESKIYSIGCESYSSSYRIGKKEIRNRLSGLGMADRSIDEFILGVFGETDYDCLIWAD